MSKLVKNSILYFAAILFLKGSSFLLLPFYTKLVSPEEYGIIYLITTFGAFLSMFLSLSIRGAVSRFYFDNKESEAIKEMYSSIVIFIFIFATISYLIILVFVNPLANFMNINKPTYLILGLIGSYMAVFYPIILALLYVQEKGKLISFITILTGVFLILVQLILVINMQDTVMAFMISYMVYGLVQFGIFIFFSKKYLIFNIKFTKLKEYLKYSLHCLPGDISVWLITFADRIMIDKYKGHVDNGLYSIGYKLGQFPEMLFQSINKAYVPHVYNKYSNFNKDSRKNVIIIATYLFALFTGIIFIVSVFSKEIIGLLDKRYQDSLWIMIMILFSYLLSGYKLIFHNPMSFNKKFVKYKSGIWIFAAFLNISLNLWLIPKYSFYGAAIATLASYIITLIPVFYFSNKAIKIEYPIKKYCLILLLSFVYSMCFLFEVNIINVLVKIIITLLYIITLIKITEFDFMFYLNKFIFKKIKREV